MIKADYPGITTQAQDLLKHQYGFRTDAQSAVSIQSVSSHDILEYEINELDNDDIPETLNSLYAQNFQPNTDGYYDIDDIESFIKQLVNLQSNEDLYLIWLVADWQACFELYTDGHIHPKTMYDIPDNFDMPFIDVYQIHSDDALISDLGFDGQLIATKHIPKPMHGFNH